MTRFCAVVSPDRNERDISSMGGTLVHMAPGCMLGTVPDALPNVTAGSYSIKPLMPNHSHDIVVVGQVTLYNRADLLQTLAQARYPTAHSDMWSDGEVLAHLYAFAGVDGIAQINGMFACAIWNREHLLLVRDAVGARKLFYAKSGQAWAAASSLHALRQWQRLTRRLNLAGVQSFLTYAFQPGEETMLQDVYELLPGEYLRIASDSTIERNHFWQLHEPAYEPDVSVDEYASHLRQLLEKAVAARLPQDEPVAVFLSGGLDSSLVTALAARLHDKPVTTYAIHFGTHLPNELGYANWVTQHCGTHHRILPFDGASVVKHLPETIAILDNPIGEPLTVPNMLMARTARAEGFRVILNGEGGDPCFGGPKNIPMLLFEWHRAHMTNEELPMARTRAYLRSYRAGYRDMAHLLSSQALDQLRHMPGPERFVLPFFANPDIQSYLNRLMMINVRTKGAHHILAKVEAITSSAGVQGRSPLFDRNIVEYAFAIPPALRLSGTTEKWILKQAVQDLLPHMVVYRSKSGMQTPIGNWLRGRFGRTPLARWFPGPLGRMAKEYLLDSHAHARGLYRRDTIRSLLHGDSRLMTRQANKVWLLLTLELWLRAYVD